MILNSVTLTDFGTFRGQQEIILKPKANRPIVLFGGKNGAGKTTLLEAIRLCFYGQSWNGPRLGRDQYLAHLDSRIHRNPNALIQASGASVALSFDYADADGIHSYALSRSWERRGSGRIDESVVVERDGRLLDEVAAERWQEFIRDMLPHGISQLFFFDGERIQHLADDHGDQERLSEAIKLLLGVDLIERLNSDLALYASRALSERRKNGQSLDLEQAEKTVSDTKAVLSELDAKRSEKQRALGDLSRDVDAVEQKLSSSGAGFARNRSSMQAERAEIQKQIRDSEEHIRGECAGLLPFAIVPSLCEDLRQQLTTEGEHDKLTAAAGILREVKRRIRAVLSSDAAIPAKTAQSAIRKCEQVVDSMLPANTLARVHDISAGECLKMLTWIESISTEVPVRARKTVQSLEQLHHRQAAIDSQLKKAPTDESLQPLLDELKNRYQVVARLQKEIAELDASIQENERRLGEAQRQYERLATSIAERAASEIRLATVPKIRAALDEFKSIVVVQKVRELEQTVTSRFNILCRKQDAMRRISIDPCTFSVAVVDRDGHPIPKSQLSAGEKQIYAISMLWALAKTSKRPLPVIIDTPLARLDRDHRQLLAKNYFPNASHQVLVLSTDTEVDEAYFESLSPSVSHAYLLDFSAIDSETRVKSGYFWREAHEAHTTAAH